MGAFGGVPSLFPAAEDDVVREQRDLARRQMENAAARSLEASTIGKGGLLVKDGGSITVEAPGTIDLQGGAFSAATLSATSTIMAGGSVTGAGIISNGGISATGDVVASGNVSAANVTGGNVFAQSLATNITATRVALWGRTSDGFIGTASSSRRFKTNIRPSEIDPLAVLQIEDVLYQYTNEVRKRDDPTYEEYVGPEHHVPTEIGAIAEQLHELGLWMFVIHEREPDGTLILDDMNEPIPSGIHYQMLVMSIFPVLRMQQARLDDIEARLRGAGL